jgi:protein-tyrosine kinase
LNADSKLSKRDKTLPVPYVVHDVDAPFEAVADDPRVLDLSPFALERERILPPGATGPHGAPYKMLRTQVLLRLDKLKAKTLAIVGNEPGSGKTLTAINLAIAMSADPDRSILLVDLDLHKPNVHKRLGFEPTVGVDDYLRQKCALRNGLVRLVGYERLLILPARERCLDSSELLSGARAQEMLRDIRQQDGEQIVIFDLPPVLQTDDALAFSRHVDAALIVVGEGRTRRRDLVRTLELLRDLPVVGTVLNATREVVDSYY